MRAGGINWLAVLAAAVAFYAIGFVIYGVLIGEERMAAMMGTDAAAMAGEEERMPFGVLMPIATAVFMALIFKWGQVIGAGTGARWGAVIALASAVPTIWYSWVYGDYPAQLALIDNAHLLLGHAAAGAVLGGWK
jgi:hypothetical protein